MLSAISIVLITLNVALNPVLNKMRDELGQRINVLAIVGERGYKQAFCDLLF